MKTNLVRIRPAYSSEISVVTGLYVEYLGCLSAYDPELKMSDRNLRHEAKKIVMDYAEGDHATIYSIMLDNLMIGFFVVGEFPQAYDYNDVYMMQFYISKPYQRKGYGRKAVELFCEAQEFYNLTDAISMFVLHGNPAVRFWSKVMGDLKYNDLVARGEIRPPDPKLMEDGELPNGKFFYWSPLTRKEKRHENTN